MIINVINYRVLFYFILYFLKFFKKPKIKYTNISLKKFQKKKNLFFKKKHNTKSIISRRLTIVFKKNFLKKKVFKKSSGNFFFKKFFFKVLLQNRKHIAKHFFKKTKKFRQKNLTKLIQKNTLNTKTSNITFENRLIYILLKSHIFLFWKDSLVFIKSGHIYVNGVKEVNDNFLLSSGDCVQIKIDKSFFLFSIFFKIFLKNKVVLYKQSSWLFFKRIFLHKSNNKNKKRKTPNFLFLLYMYKYNTDRYLEVDYVTLTIFLLKKYNFSQNYTYFLRKTFSFKLFALYNFKKKN